MTKNTMAKYEVMLYPKAYRDIDDIYAYIAGKGYKQLLKDNYMAIFKIDEANKKVYVVTVQYQGRDL